MLKRRVHGLVGREHRAAVGTPGQVRTHTRALLRRERVVVVTRQQRTDALASHGSHGFCSPRYTARKRSLARYKVILTLPLDMCMAAAISSMERPSRARISKHARWEGVNCARAARRASPWA